MNILFLHPNFPAQFKSPCLELAKYTHHIKFICQTHYGRSISGVEKLVLKGRGSHENTLLSSKNEHNRTLFRGKIYRESFLILKDAGWKIMAVSGGFTIITDRLKKNLSFLPHPPSESKILDFD